MKYLLTALLIILQALCAFINVCAEESNVVPLFIETSDGKLVLENYTENISGKLYFDGAYPFEHGLSIVIRDGLYGVIDLQGNEIVPCEYESISVHDNGIIVRLNDRYTLLSLHGEPMINESYQMVFYNGYGFVVVDHDQYGLIDPIGTTILDVEWADIGAFCDGWMLIVDSNDSYNYINPNRELLLDYWVDYGSYFSNGYAAYGLDEEIFMMDTQGNKQRTNFIDIDLFPVNGKFFAKDIHGNMGIYDAEEDIFSICSVDRFGTISENLISVKRGDKWGYCNIKGEIVIEPIYDEVRPFSEGFTCVRLENTWIYMDRFGNRINSVAYSQAYNFCEGYAACVDLISGKLGFIDQSGQWMIEPKFQITHEVFFKNGICNLGGYDPWVGFFIDKNGNVLWQFQFDIDYFVQ